MINASEIPPLYFLNNRYRVIQVLGEGGFGQTFLAEDTHMPSNRRCVVKQLKPINDNPKIHQLVQKRFQREAAILETLSESNQQIPKLYAYFAQGDQFYLVEEWIEGDTLTQKLQKEGRLSENVARDILSQILMVIDYIHQKTIIHRDLKPDNIILRQQDGLPVLIDFGAVKETMGTVLDSKGNTEHSIVVGTPGFMPSEQVAGRPIYSSDLYSLGLTVIYLLSGKLPQELDTDHSSGSLLWRDYTPQVSDAFAAILDQAIQLHPRDRFTTAREMLQALGSLNTVTYSPVPRVVSPPTPFKIKTVVVAPASEIITTQIPSLQNSLVPKEWKKAVMIGGLIGGSIIASTVALKTPFLNVLQDFQKLTQIKYTSTSNSKSTPKDPQPSPKRSSLTNAVIVGSPGKKNIRSGPGTNYRQRHIAYPGDRVQVIGSETDQGGYRWYKIYFPKSKAEGWIASQLLLIDGQNASPQPTPTPISTPRSSTNAMLIGSPGSKNIRTGPGTNYRARHIAYPGDRVQIIGQDYDQGGYLWYKVYFPKSGADGWIAAQLIKVD